MSTILYNHLTRQNITTYICYLDFFKTSLICVLRQDCEVKHDSRVKKHRKAN